MSLGILPRVLKYSNFASEGIDCSNFAFGDCIPKITQHLHTVMVSLTGPIYLSSSFATTKQKQKHNILQGNNFLRYLISTSPQTNIYFLILLPKMEFSILSNPLDSHCILLGTDPKDTLSF